MDNTDEWVRAVRELLLKDDGAPSYKTRVYGIEIQVFPGVFSPRYFPETEWFADTLIPLARGKSILEIGSGTGAIPVILARNGAIVSATDINPESVRNIEANFKAHNILGKIYGGSLFSSIPEEEKFDLIFWNHPFHNSSEQTEDSSILAFEDYNYNYLREYLALGQKYLTTDGRLLLGSCNLADQEEIKRICTEQGLKRELIANKLFPKEETNTADEEYLLLELTKE